MLAMYRMITVVNRFPMSPAALASELITSTKTSRGAIPFSAPTNKSPGTLRKVAFGISIPSSAPSTRPIRILMTRVVSLQTLNIAFIPK